MKKIFLMLLLILINLAIYSLDSDDVSTLYSVQKGLFNEGEEATEGNELDILLQREENENNKKLLNTQISSEQKLEEMTEQKLEEIAIESIDNEDEKKISIYKKYFNDLINVQSDTVIFGKSIIDNSQAIKTTSVIAKDYVLGIGDTLAIKSWSDLLTSSNGSNSNGSPVMTITVNKLGKIFIPELGVINVLGKTLAEAETEILEKASKKIRGYNIDISLQGMRNINIFVVGEVVSPGIYGGTPFMNLLNVLNLSGGITENSSIRNISILRNNEEIKIDLYDYLLKNKKLEDLELLDGDRIYVPMLENKIAVTGNVKREAIYEIKTEKTIKEIIDLAGGLTKEANSNSFQAKLIENGQIKALNLTDKNSELNLNYISLNIGQIDEEIKNGVYILGNIVNPSLYELKDGMTYKDILELSGGYKKDTYFESVSIVRYINDGAYKKIINFNPKVENPLLKKEDSIYVYNKEDINQKKYADITGPLNNPGTFEIYQGFRVSNLIYSAKGIKKEETVYLKRADLFRITENGRLRVLSINLEKALAGDSEENLVLMPNDILQIYSYDDIIQYDDIHILGEVRLPGKFRYYEHMTLKDALFYAKGLKLKADSNLIVARNNDEKGEIEELNVDYVRYPDFEILEDDIIFVRKKISWQKIRMVTLEGYVNYPGEYIINDFETLNDVINRAGGFKEEAYPKGTELTRKEMAVEEARELNLEKEMKLAIEENNVQMKVINFDYNAAKRKFNTLVELEDGDVIYVPAKQTTVKIVGEVYIPSMILYDKNFKNYKDYIEAAGGFTEKARKAKVFVIKANGKAVKDISKQKIEAGDTIVVPRDTREQNGFDRFVEVLRVGVELLTTIVLVDVLTD